MCQIWLRSDRRECNAGMTISKCTKTAASSNVSNHLSRTPAAWCASGAAHHARPYRNLGRRISLLITCCISNLFTRVNSLQRQRSVVACMNHTTTQASHRPANRPAFGGTRHFFSGVYSWLVKVLGQFSIIILGG